MFDYMVHDALYEYNRQKVMLLKTYNTTFAGYTTTHFFQLATKRNKPIKHNAFRFWVITSLLNVTQTYSTLRNVYTKQIKNTVAQSFEKFTTYRHAYHLVDASPWPFVVAMSLLAVTMGGVLYMHQITVGGFTLTLGLSSLLFCMAVWFRDVIREGTFEGHHTALVQRGLKAGMLLFIVSEVMFFASFFWGFFHSSLAPAVQIGGIWPPLGISVFNPWEIPLLNTLILLTSGASVTWAHYAIRSRQVRQLSMAAYDRRNVFSMAERYLLNHSRTLTYGASPTVHTHVRQTLRNVVKDINVFLITGSDIVSAYRNGRTLDINSLLKKSTQGSWVDSLLGGKLSYSQNYIVRRLFKKSRQDFLVALAITIFLGLIFTIIQYYEYKHATFTISDSVYGSTFFLTTGFHGVHVIVGTLFLIVCFFRGLAYHFTTTHHVGLESAIWYWHFVDVVWLGLYISIYHWGGSATV